jgi:hypothetical protein
VGAWAKQQFAGKLWMWALGRQCLIGQGNIKNVFSWCWLLSCMGRRNAAVLRYSNTKSSFQCHWCWYEVFLYRYKERSEIEALYFHINTLLKSLNQPAFGPQEGQLIHDLERSWESLEHAEHRREVALRQELLRQERLEQLNYKFERKVSGRQSVCLFCAQSGRSIKWTALYSLSIHFH